MADSETMIEQKEDANWLARRIAPGILWAMKNPKSAIVTGFVTVSAFWAFFGSTIANVAGAKGSHEAFDSVVVMMVSMSKKVDVIAVRLDTMAVRVDTVAATAKDLKGAFNEISGGAAAMRRYKKKEREAIDFLRGVSTAARPDHTNYVSIQPNQRRTQ